MTKFIGKKNTPYLLRKDIFSKSVLRYTKNIFEKYLVVHCYNCCFIAVLSTDRKKMLSWLSKLPRDIPQHKFVNKLHVLFFMIVCYNLFCPIVDQKIKADKQKQMTTSEEKSAASVFRFFATE
jgi:hypothetical protein